VKYWQTAIAILAALFTSLAFAEDFKTINGKEYKNATVSHIEADGIVLKTKSGISKIYFAELPKEVQERFHYYPQKGATYSAEQHSNVAVSAIPTKWVYSEFQDDMGRGTTRMAKLVSSNTVHFGFPYKGETHATLKLRRSPKSGQAIMLTVERGQFLSTYTKDFVTVRFDDGELQKFAIGEPEDSTSDLRFIHDDNGTFINQLRGAKSLKIEATFYQEGTEAFEFDVHGLDW
jgi:hypothetical protein